MAPPLPMGASNQDGELTRILAEVAEGIPGAADRLWPHVYDELKGYVRGQLARRRGLAVDPTDVVHEVYLRLVEQTRASATGRGHFLALAARVVRQVLVDLSRRQRAQKRGGGRAGITLDSRLMGRESTLVDALDLDAALLELARDEPRCAELVELRFFGGMTISEAAAHLGVSTATAERDWRFARAWLEGRLTG